MRIVRLEEPAGERLFRLHHLTDTHLGAPDFDETRFRARVQAIADDPQARWTFGGDCGDLIKHNDRRYSPTELEMRYRMATDVRLATEEHALELFRPITGKCWGWCDGNHERKFDEVFGGKFGLEVCTQLGIQDRWVGYRGFVNVACRPTKTQKVALLIDLQHGWQVGRLKGAFLVQAERELGMTSADVVLRGHNHQPNGHVFVTLAVDQQVKGVMRKFRTVVNGGTWRKGYRDDLAPIDPDRLSEAEGDLWGETKGFRAEPIGGPILELDVQMNTGPGKGPAFVHHRLIKGEL